MTLLYGVASVVLLWWVLITFTRANPAALANALRLAGGVLALGAAALFGFRGRIDVALGLAGVGAWLLGWGGFTIPSFGASTQRTPGAVSRVQSVMIEMELDHELGKMDGTVLAGEKAGRRLDDLDERSLQQLISQCGQDDPDGVRLLESYLDHRFPGWRQEGERSEQPQADARAETGAMTAEEAFQILGLAPDASADAIRQAHRTLMKKLHPDQGGTTYLAARVNQAKEVLLRLRE